MFRIRDRVLAVQPAPHGFFKSDLRVELVSEAVVHCQVFGFRGMIAALRC